MSARPEAPAEYSVTPWSYNPSAWSHRIVVALLATVAMFISAYMGLYQWRLIGAAWDPVFGDQTEYVLDSNVSERMRSWLRLPDAILGTLAYLGDVVFALAGSVHRWQYRPWLVVVFGIDVIPLGIVSAVLVFLQGTVVGAWCFLCLITAVLSLILIYCAYDEVWSSLVFLGRVWKRYRSPSLLLQTFCGVASPEAAQIADEMKQTFTDKRGG